MATWQPTDKQKRVLTKLKRDLDRSKKRQEDFLRDVATYAAVYWANDHTPVERDEKGLSKDGLLHEFTAYGYQQLETAVPRFLQQDSQFDLIPRDITEEGLLGAKASRQLLDYYLDQTKFPAKKEWFVRTALQNGLTWAHVIWDEDYVTKKVRKPKAVILQEVKDSMGMVDEEGNPVLPEPFEEKEVCLFSGPRVITVSPKDIRWDPDARSMDECEFVYYRIKLTRDELKTRQEKGVYENIEFLTLPGQKTSQGPEDDLLGEDLADGYYEIWEKWTRDRVVTYAPNDNVILSDRPNPYWHGKLPFVACAPNMVPDNIVGVSEMWVIRPLQRTAWFMDNAQLNLLQLAMNPPVEVLEDWPGANHLKLTPGERVKVPELGTHFAPVKIDYGMAQNLAQTDAIVDRIYSSTGINNEISASPVGTVSTSRTATQSLQQNREANARMALKMMNFNIFWVDIAEQVLELAAQFVTEDQVIQIAGQEPGQYDLVTIDSDVLAMGYKFMVKNSTEVLNQELAKQESNEVLSTLAQFNGQPFADGSTIDMARAVKDYLKAHDLDPEGYFQPAQPVDPATGEMTPPQGYSGPPEVDPATGQPMDAQMQLPMEPPPPADPMGPQMPPLM